MVSVRTLKNSKYKWCKNPAWKELYILEDASLQATWGKLVEGGKEAKMLNGQKRSLEKLNEIPKGDRSGRGEGLRPKSAIYTLNRDEEHPRPIFMRESTPPRPHPGYEYKKDGGSRRQFKSLSVDICRDISLECGFQTSDQQFMRLRLFIPETLFIFRVSIELYKHEWKL